MRRVARRQRTLHFLHELGLELHGTEAVDLAVDVVVAIDQADVLDLGADLDGTGRALDLEVRHEHHGVAVLQHIAIGVFPHTRGLGFGSGGVTAPFMGALGADQHGAIFIGVLGLALWAGRQGVHVGSFGVFGLWPWWLLRKQLQKQ